MSQLTTGLPMGSVPMGSIIAFGLPIASIPTGWLLCDGSSIPPTYQNLITAIGKTTPNLSGRTLVASGPSADGQMITFEAGQTGGESVHILSVEEMPSHSHSFTGYNTNYRPAGTNIADSGDDISAADCSCWGTEPTTSVGSNNGHNNMQPYYVVNYIIYTGD